MKNLLIIVCFIIYISSCKKTDNSINPIDNNILRTSKINEKLNTKKDSLILEKDTANYFTKITTASIQNVNNSIKIEQNNTNEQITVNSLQNSDLVRKSTDKTIINNLFFPKKVVSGISYSFENPFCNLYDLYYSSHQEAEEVIKNIEYIFSKKTNLNSDFLNYVESCVIYLLLKNTRITIYKGFFGKCDKNILFDNPKFIKEYDSVYLLYFTQDENTHKDIPYIKKIK